MVPLCYQTVVHPVLSVCDVGVLWPNGWMDQDATCMEVGLDPVHIVLDRAEIWGLSPLGWSWARI